MATMVGQKTRLEMTLWKHFVLVLLNNDTKIIMMFVYYLQEDQKRTFGSAGNPILISGIN